MRNLNRDDSYNGFTEGFENYLNEISNYCFVTDMDVPSKAIYFCRGKEVYENAYIVDTKIKNILEAEKTKEEIILTFDPDFNLLKYSFYLNKKVSIQLVGSLSTKGRKYLDFLDKEYKNQFSDSVHEACVNTEKEIENLIESIEKLKSVGVTSDLYVSFLKKEFFLFFKDTIALPLLCVRATIILDDDNYKDIKYFVLKTLNIVDESRQKIIKGRIKGFEEILENNRLFPRKYSLVEMVSPLLKSYDFRSLYALGVKNRVPLQVTQIFQYLNILFTNSGSDSKWELSFDTLDSISLKSQFREGIENFEGVIENEEDFFDLKLMLSKAQVYLELTNYINFIATLQKFMEKYLKLIGAGKPQTIDKKVIKALKLYENNEESIAFKVISLIRFCFDRKEDSAMKLTSREYVPVNYVRNNFQHEDIGLTEKEFTEKVGYLTQEQFEDVEHTGTFKKFLAIFCLPKKNIFDQLNEKVISILKTPNF